MGMEKIRDGKFFDTVFGKVQGYGPGQALLFKDDFTAEDGREHDHAEGDQGFGFWMGIPQARLPEPFIKPSVHHHPSLDPGFRIKIIFPVKRNTVMLVPPVWIKAYAQRDVVLSFHQSGLLSNH